MKNFTLLSGLKNNKVIAMKQRFTRVLATALVAVSVLISGGAFAQTITFTGATTDFTTPGITALAAGSGAVTYYASTDGTFMYLGAFRTGGSTWGTTDHFTFYVDADPRSAPTTAGNGSTVGLAWDNQTPTMPFRADYRVAIRTDGSTGSGLGSSFYSSNNTTTNTATWTTGGANAKGYTQYVSNAANGGMEIRVPLSDFGNPASVYLSMFASFSGAGGGFFGPATGTFTGNTLSGYLRNLGVYKTTGNLTAGTVTTPITDLTSTGTVTGDYGDITLTGGATTTVSTSGLSFTGTMSWNGGSTTTILAVPASATLFVGGRGVGGTAGQMTVTTSSTSAASIASSAGTISFLGNGIINGTNTLKTFQGTVTVTTGGALDFNTATSFSSGTFLQINAGINFRQ